MEKIAKVDTTSPLTAARQAAALQADNPALGSDSEQALTDLAKSITRSGTEGNYIYSSIALNKLDNKNSLEYYFAFPNINHNDGKPTDYKDYLYRAVTYLVAHDDKNNTDTVILSKPLYFEIYDMATITQGVATPTN